VCSSDLDLVKLMIGRIKKGNMTAQDASALLAKQCVCGIYNTSRSADLLTEMAAVE
jgi:hypothetical protein